MGKKVAAYSLEITVYAFVYYTFCTASTSLCLRKLPLCALRWQRDKVSSWRRCRQPCTTAMGSIIRPWSGCAWTGTSWYRSGCVTFSFLQFLTPHSGIISNTLSHVSGELTTKNKQKNPSKQQQENSHMLILLLHG